MIRKVALSSCVVGGLIFVVYLIALYFELSADLDKVRHYSPKVATQIYDRKNRLIANVFDTEFRFYAKFDEIPPRMIEALLAIEDTLFFEHGGINYDGIIRAMLKNIRTGRLGEGGSTLTQQVVKNIILTRERTISRKIKEALLTVQVEEIISKEQILEIYLNEVFLGHGYYGVKTAALGYFKKTLNQLSLKEIAILVGLPQSPSTYDPTKNLDLALTRANDIIRRMYDLGWISKEYRDSSLAEKPTVYHQTLTQNVAPYVTDYALRQLSSIKDIKTGGYTIKLHIDLDYQEVAQKALKNGYTALQARQLKLLQAQRPKGAEPAILPSEDDLTANDTLNGAVVITDNKTGKILALVGGVNHEKSPYNRAVDAYRQMGSSIKPFIYQIAFDRGYSTATQVPDAARSFDEWNPRNSGGKFQGMVTLQDALIHSRNLATINVATLVGFSNIYNGLLNFGFSGFSADMTIAIGSLNATPIMVAKEYSIFSNYGVRNEPVLIDSVIDPQGNVFSYETQSEVIISPEQSFLTTSVLREVVRAGTGRRAAVSGIETAGKTGTTNNNVDFWFCGYTPDVQAIIWFGRDDNSPIGRYESASAVAAPVFAEIVAGAVRIDPSLRRIFPRPEAVRSKTIDKNTFFYTRTSPLPNISNIVTEQNLY
ncbi:penicillin-binding protein 1A [Helicobacter sp. MIT 01-3238]|uniref:penicillin-binding protein 1A n=1 Tax=Helicobacter sp. MIT 01-3238 TaxID=398627 RepID=UPI000E1F0EAC|nr:PBP1A family penicillin-binding protein [Helicobacter sp. MIT 01-3238]RDU52513.1 penicillin-binding protein [Helicobacter sp. MIT 01-3238]